MHFFVDSAKSSTPILPLPKAEAEAWLKKQPKATQAWAAAQNFPKTATQLVVPNESGGVARVIATYDPFTEFWAIAGLPAILPAGSYHIESKAKPAQLENWCLGWVLAHYQFTKYTKKDALSAKLVWPAKVSKVRVLQLAEATFLGRDLINTPTNDMGPSHLAEAAQRLAKQHKADCKVIVGDDLLKQNYPAIHAVGRAAENKPRLIDIRWGSPKHPKLTLVGKGVCFDTGGLDLKPLSSMKLMKKDMGGAALVLALAHVIMASKLPVRLRVLIPAVENNVSGNAYRPQDVLKTRKGLTIEVGSTDAEGRIILADALAEADSENPDLIIDVATLTGAARVALGTEIPALFSLKGATARKMMDAGQDAADPLWQLPLWQGYAEDNRSLIADVSNSPDSSYGGAITAALFLKRFIEKATDWVHIDTMAWNIKPKPGRAVGGETLSLRALYSYLESRYR